MPIDFSKREHAILSLFKKNEQFIYNNKRYTILFSAKPTCPSGEPKTDIYVSAVADTKEKTEFKISFKKENADFLENKIKAERAEQILGENWKLLWDFMCIYRFVGANVFIVVFISLILHH